jgi:F0F1-type ATP synthase assembly protein I
MINNSSDQKPENKKGKKGEFFRFLGVASTVGINLVISTFVGFAIGFWVFDKYLDTFPWFTAIFLLLGIASGFRYLFRIAKRAGEKNNEEEGGK